MVGTERVIRRLADAARESARIAGEDREARDAAIAQGDQDGLGLRHLARISGLSVSHVQRIIVMATATRQLDG